jgi:hypothetical protein
MFDSLTLSSNLIRARIPTANILTASYNQVSSALGVFGDTSDALATPILSH